MKIEYLEGDLLAHRETVIIHGCNSLGKFGRGFAEAVKKQHPFAVDAYFEAHKMAGLVLGSVVWAEKNGILVGNCITQATIGNDGKQHVSYYAIRSCMRQVNAAAAEGVPGTDFEDGFTRVSMPLIGADLGGGDWKIISAIIEEELTVAAPVVYVLPGRKPSASELRSFR